MGINPDHQRHMLARFVLGHLGKSSQDDEIAWPGEVGGRAVDADRSRASRARQRVRAEARAVGHIPDVHLFVSQDACCIEEILIDGVSAVRHMLHPGTAYDNSVLGRDPQPGSGLVRQEDVGTGEPAQPRHYRWYQDVT